MKLFLLAAPLLLLAACGTPQPAKTLTPAQKLAIVDHIDTTDQRVAQMDKLLQSLSGKFKEPQDTIAEYTSRAEDVLREKGVVTDNLEILGNMDGLKADAAAMSTYKDAITMYLMIRAK